MAAAQKANCRSNHAESLSGIIGANAIGSRPIGETAALAAIIIAVLCEPSLSREFYKCDGGFRIYYFALVETRSRTPYGLHHIDGSNLSYRCGILPNTNGINVFAVKCEPQREDIWQRINFDSVGPETHWNCLRREGRSQREIWDFRYFLHLFSKERMTGVERWLRRRGRVKFTEIDDLSSWQTSDICERPFNTEGEIRAVSFQDADFRDRPPQPRPLFGNEHVSCQMVGRFGRPCGLLSSVGSRYSNSDGRLHVAGLLSSKTHKLGSNLTQSGSGIYQPTRNTGQYKGEEGDKEPFIVVHKANGGRDEPNHTANRFYAIGVFAYLMIPVMGLVCRWRTGLILSCWGVLTALLIVLAV